MVAAADGPAVARTAMVLGMVHVQDSTDDDDAIVEEVAATADTTRGYRV